MFASGIKLLLFFQANVTRQVSAAVGSLLTKTQLLPIYLQVMKEQGVLAPLSYHVQVYLNGKFYGLDGVIEPVDSKMLQRFNLPKSGPLFKSLSGELSNLRWDLPLSEMPFYFSQDGPVANWQLLANFTKGLAGGGPGTR